MNPSIEILLWLLIVTFGLAFAALSLWRAHKVLRNVRARGASIEVVGDSRHVRSNQLLLVLGWLLFLAVGLYAFMTPPEPRPPVTPQEWLTLAGLLSAVAVWAVMTASDHLYTRQLWQHALRIQRERTEQQQQQMSDPEPPPA